MHHEPTRREKRESKFTYSAEQGNFETELTTYGNEAKGLSKSGFKVKRELGSSKNALPSKASWKKAFGDTIPPIVSDYISGRIKTFPEVSNWAQKLYVIAARVNYEKTHQSNIE